MVDEPRHNPVLLLQRFYKRATNFTKSVVPKRPRLDKLKSTGKHEQYARPGKRDINNTDSAKALSRKNSHHTGDVCRWRLVLIIAQHKPAMVSQTGRAWAESDTNKK